MVFRHKIDRPLQKVIDSWEARGDLEAGKEREGANGAEGRRDRRISGCEERNE